MKSKPVGFYILLIACILFGLVIAVSFIKFILFVGFTILAVMFHYNLIAAMPDPSILDLIPDLLPPWMCAIFIIMYVLYRSMIIDEFPPNPR
jgi:hypothetical protein